MEFKKLSEQYSIKDVTEQGWVISGGATLEMNDRLIIYFDVLEEDIKIGSLNYIRPIDNNATISYNIPEIDRYDFINYANEFLNKILENFENFEENK